MRWQDDHGGTELLRVGADDAPHGVGVGCEPEHGVPNVDARHVFQHRHELVGDEFLGSLALRVPTLVMLSQRQVQTLAKTHPQLLCFGVGH